jgi:hypothetical protein
MIDVAAGALLNPLLCLVDELVAIAKQDRTGRARSGASGLQSACQSLFVTEDALLMQYRQPMQRDSS